MKFFHSIRWRLQLWHGLLLVIVLAGFGITAYQLQRANQLRRIDEELQFRVGVLGGLLRQGGQRPFHVAPRDERLFDSTATNRFYYVLWFREGSVLSSSASAPAEIRIPDRHTKAYAIRMRGTARELYHFTPPGECILVGRDIATVWADLHRLAAWLIASGAAVLSLGLLGGAWVAAQAIRPVKDITATAARIAAGDLGQRIPQPSTQTELSELTEVLNSTFSRLEAAFAQQTRFTSDAAHELRTPVSVILAQTQAALGRERSSSEYREALAACQRAAQRMRNLTDSLLRLARLDGRVEPIQRINFDIAKTAHECVEALRPLASDRGVAIHCDLAPASCSGDPERISQVISNLVTNAIQYNKPAGEVRVSTQQQNGEAILSVIDTGVGIAAEAIDHVFERFYRADKSRSAASGGTGLGLAIAKAIVEEHGGTIQVTSRAGEGACFSVHLPSTSA
ncbi:MAG TPA: ATP-binding protein [Verrucomicrobiae bacterium]|nr:ATP-binding protein [Verrucomicrobiae bacterium]